MERKRTAPASVAASFVYAMVACLALNDAVRVAMIKWHVLNSVASKPADVTPEIAKRAYELYEQGCRRDGRAVQDWEQASTRFGKINPINEKTQRVAHCEKVGR